MKKISLITLSTLAILFSICLPNFNVLAKEQDTSTEIIKTTENMFSDLDNNEKVLMLPDGGYLHGSGFITDSENSDQIIAEYNSETDPNSITVQEAKAQVVNSIKNDTSIIQPRAATVPTQNFTLAANASYRSSNFSGSGWRFGGYRFYPEPSSGYYLLWTSYGDDARVGNTWEATQTLNGTISGTTIYNNVSTYVNKGTLGQIYYSYNPVNDSYYIVANW